MKRFIFILLILGVILPAVARADMPVVQDIRYGINAGKTRIVVDLDRKSDFRAFTLADPPRLVIDLPRSEWRIPRSRPVTTGDLLRSFRSGELEDGLTRVVFDLKKPAVIASAFTLERSGTAKDRIVVDVQAASDNLFRARLESIFGNKNLTGTNRSPPAVSSLAAARNADIQKAVPPVADDAALPSRKPVPSAPVPARPSKERQYVIVIDAGHGGADPGAVSEHGDLEKKVTLSVAKELRRQLEETGRYRVVMTRDKDMHVKLRDRLDMARRNRADLFISIHADKISSANVRGASIYTLSRTASDAETARLAERENNAGVVAGVDLSSESDDVAGILLDLAMREKMNESSLLARFLEEAFRSKSIKLLPNSHRSAGFAVLKAPDVPSVLIEAGFMSNPEEVKLLNSAEFQRRISSAIVTGVDAYFRKIRALQKI